jgi:nicotinamide riboside transporter PnuC
VLETGLTAISLFGNYLNCRKKRCCFLLWIGCNIGWASVDILSGAYSRAVLDIVQIAFSLYGYREWGSTKSR